MVSHHNNHMEKLMEKLSELVKLRVSVARIAQMRERDNERTKERITLHEQSM